MRFVILATLASITLAPPAFAQDSGAASGQASAETVQALGAGVRVTAAVVAVPLRLAGNVSGAVIKQTFAGLGEGSKEDPFAGTALQVDDEVLSNRKPVQPAGMRSAQPAPVVPRAGQ